MGLKSEVASVPAVTQTDRDRMFRLIAICRDMEKIRLQVLVHVRKAVEMIPHISYKSRVYMVDWDKTDKLKTEISDVMPVNPECGLL